MPSSTIGVEAKAPNPVATVKSKLHLTFSDATVVGPAGRSQEGEGNAQ